MLNRACITGLFSGMLLATGCGSGGGTAQLRLVLASPDTPSVNILIDGKSVATDMADGSSTGYISVKSGSRHIQLVPANSSSTKPILDETLSIGASTNQTLLITGPIAGIKTVVLSDGSTTTVTGDGYVRVFNASTALAPADVYIVPAGTSLVGATPMATSLPFDQAAPYQAVVAGNYQVFLMAPGTTNVLLGTGSIGLNASANQTVVVLDSPTGGPIFLQ